MKRKIKFRAYANFDGKNQMVYCDKIEINDNGLWLGWGLNHLDDSSGKTIIMQFTGLLDKNGKEIYEGDMVKMWEHHFSDEGVVSFHKGSFVVGKYQCPVSEFQNLEILGNIYENPELLKTCKINF